MRFPSLLLAAFLLPAVAFAQQSPTLLIIGQSNAQGAGNGDSAQTANFSAAQAQEIIWTASGAPPYYGTGYLTAIKDPMSRNAIANMKSNKASFVPAICEVIRDSMGRKPYVSHHAVGGSMMFVPTGGTAMWTPACQNVATSVNKTNGLLRQAAVPDSLDWLIIALGETDGAKHGQYPASYLAAPDSTVLDTAMLANGTLTSYPAPRGYPNPTNLPNIYGNYKALIDHYRLKYGKRLGVILVQTGKWTGNTAVVARGCEQIRWYQRQYVRDEQAKGMRTYIVRGTENLPTVDGVHFTVSKTVPDGYNTIGRRIGRVIQLHQIR